MYSPWGEIQESRTVVRGFNIVSTSSHGGAMLAKGFAEKNLSIEAQKRGTLYGGYLCYEEDCDICIPSFELLRHKILGLKPFLSKITLFELLDKLYCDPQHHKETQEKIDYFHRCLSSYHADYLLEIGVVSTEPEYTHWKEHKQANEMKANKDPNFIVAALGILNTGLVKVWTADNKLHYVTEPSYKQKTLNLLSDCDLVDILRLREVLDSQEISLQDKVEIREYVDKVDAEAILVSVEG